MSSPSNDGWLRPTVPSTIRSEVIGDFQEPYGAIFGEFSKVDPRFIDLRSQVVLRLRVVGKLSPQSRNLCRNTSQVHYKLAATYLRRLAVSILPVVNSPWEN